MSSTDKPMSKDVTFPVFLSETDLFGHSSSFSSTSSESSFSPRIFNSTSDFKVKSICDESNEISSSTELPTFDFEKTKKGVGITLVAGQTENETKARKLNKTEESRLETLRLHFEKQKTMFEKQYRQSERRFRIRSARVLPNTSSLGGKIRVNAMAGNARPKSLPAHLPSMNNKSTQIKGNSEHSGCKSDNKCATCERIQKAVKFYEKEMKTNFAIENSHHTVCLFSDSQIKNFINLVESKYCGDLPNVAEMLHSPKHNGIKDGRLSDCNSPRKSVGIHDRIKAFCKSQEEFNKKHPVSRSVKTYIDNERIAQAKLATKVSYTKKT